MSTPANVSSALLSGIFHKISSTLMAVAILILVSNNAVGQDMASKTGTFTGMNKHVTTGTAEVIKTDAGYIIKLGADFSFDGAPDPKVALGKDGEYDPATLIEPLKSNTGEQSYAVPESIDVSAYNEVYIWCEKFAVGLGVAQIK